METLSAWSRALRDPSLRDLPYKIETNEHGQLVMSPQKPVEEGALEVWTCDMKGRMRFFDGSGERSASGHAPSFPLRTE